MPPAFVENVGQAKFSDGRAATYVDATVALPGATAYVHSTGLHIALSRIHVDTSVRSFERTYDTEEFRVDMRLIGSNPSPRLERLQPVPGHVRYILPGMGANGATASLHSTLLYRDVWPFAGRSHTCIIESSGVYCWGDNNDGQIGIGEEYTSDYIDDLIDARETEIEEELLSEPDKYGGQDPGDVAVAEIAAI
jgi:hypothetical protein